MRALISLVSLICLTASVARAQGWTPVADEVAEALLARLSKGLDGAKDEAKAKDAAWKAVLPMLAPQGVFHAEDTVGLDDNSTITRYAAWRTGPELPKLRDAIMLFLTISDPGVCEASECVVAASHFATTLVLRTGPAGKPHIVGLFETNSLVDEGRQAAIDAAIAQWREAIEVRYPKVVKLPPVAPAPGSSLSRQKARELNVEGLDALKKDDPKGAAALFARAVGEDPSHYLARYNLACAHSLAGHKARAIATLATFKAATDCPACQVRLARAALDEDFKSIQADPAFKAVIAGAVVPMTDPSAVGKAVDTVFQGGSVDMTPFVDPLQPVSVTVKSSLSGDTTTAMVDGRGLAAHFKAMRSETVAVNGMDGMTCAAPSATGSACCVSGEQMLGHNALFLQKVCVEADGAGWSTLRTIEIIDGD